MLFDADPPSLHPSTVLRNPGRLARWARQLAVRWEPRVPLLVFTMKHKNIRFKVKVREEQEQETPFSSGKTQLVFPAGDGTRGA